MIKASRTIHPAFTAAVLALGTLVGTSPAMAGGDTTKLEAELLPPAGAADPLASGKAKWEQRADRTRTSTEIEDVQLADGTLITISMCGSTTTVTLSGQFADFNADTRDGQLVPTCTEGNLVTVNADGVVILEGQLGSK